LPGGVSEDVADEARCDLASSHALAEPAESFAEDLLVEVPFRHRASGHGRPRVGVARLVAGEEVVEGTRRGVPFGERAAEVPDLAEGGDQRSVAVLVVEDGALIDPG